jgi:hypothetical protein
VPKYLLTSPTIALFPQDGRHVARSIPSGSVVVTANAEGEKLVEVVWNHKKALMFSEDLRSRGQLLESNRTRPFLRIRKAHNSE